MRALHLCSICIILFGLTNTVSGSAWRRSPPSLTTLGASTFQSDFPNGAAVSVQVQADAGLLQGRLFVTMDGTIYSVQDALIPPHQPGEVVTLQAHWNALTLTRDPSPPWMPLQLWWELYDLAGNELTTSPEQFLYTDSRRPWVATEGVHVSVYAYNQSSDLTAYAAQVGEDAISHLQSVFGYTLPYRPSLVFYNSATEGDADLGRNGAQFGSYIVGRAYPGSSGVVLLASSDRAYLQRTIRHELTHLFQYQIGAKLFDAPHWWIEGDAKAQEPPASIDRSLSYTQSVAFGQGLPNLAAWDSRDFSGESSLDNALLIGASFVIFLQQIYGTQSHVQFYQNWKAGGDFGSSFQATYGKSLAELDGLWRGWITDNNSIVASSDSGSTGSFEVPAVMLPDIPEGMGRVNAYWLNFRALPNLDSDVVALLSIGQLLLPIGRDEGGDWLLVELPDGTQGWLYSEFVDYDGSKNDLTVSFYPIPCDDPKAKDCQ